MEVAVRQPGRAGGDSKVSTGLEYPHTVYWGFTWTGCCAECTIESSMLWRRWYFPPFILLGSKATESLVQVTPPVMAQPGLIPKPRPSTNMLKRLKNKKKRGREFFICLAATHFIFCLNLKWFSLLKYPLAKWLSNDVTLAMCLMSKTSLWEKPAIKGEIKASYLDVTALGNQVDDCLLRDFSDDLSGDFQNRKSLGVKLNFFEAPVAWPPQAKVECKPGLSEDKILCFWRTYYMLDTLLAVLHLLSIRTFENSWGRYCSHFTGRKNPRNRKAEQLT